MIILENLVTLNIDQMQAVIRGMRNPMNSWAKSDTTMTTIGQADFDLMMKLCKAGSEHRKFMRMMPVLLDITAPLYWWKEFDTYKIGTVRNSCSTMHKLHSRDLTMDDFSHEHMDEYCEQMLQYQINTINIYRRKYKNTGTKDDWYRMVQTLPSSYNQRSTVMLNYEVIYNIIHQRSAHKLDEWHVFCDYMREHLPMSALITTGGNHDAG